MAVDTHGVTGKGWYGFDLDGTLAVYDKWEGIDHIGEPVKPMVDLIKRMHAEGKVVKILTARVSPRPSPETKPSPFADMNWSTDEALPDYVEKTLGDRPAEETILTRAMLAHEIYHAGTWGARDFIADWCYKNLGFCPKITHEKDHLMLELYDDRVKQVVPNTGILVEDMVGPRIEIHPVEIHREKVSASDFAFMMIGKLTILFAVAALVLSAAKMMFN